MKRNVHSRLKEYTYTNEANMAYPLPDKATEIIITMINIIPNHITKVKIIEMELTLQRRE